jgi:hypothetical protein
MTFIVKLLSRFRSKPVVAVPVEHSYLESEFTASVLKVARDRTQREKEAREAAVGKQTEK